MRLGKMERLALKEKNRIRGKEREAISFRNAMSPHRTPHRTGHVRSVYDNPTPRGKARAIWGLQSRQSRAVKVYM
jgi:hypothetical protein